MPNRTHRFRILAAIAAALVLSAALVTPSLADSTARSASNFAGGAGTVIYLAAAVGLPLLQDGKHGTVDALRTADALGTSLVIAQGLTSVVHEERPNHENNQSFPSDHATAAFAVATVQSADHPGEALYWYLGATAIAQSRVRIREHTEGDVIAGALIGFGTARLELSAPHGLILSPFIAPAQHAEGLTLSAPIR